MIGRAHTYFRPYCRRKKGTEALAIARASILLWIAIVSGTLLSAAQAAQTLRVGKASSSAFIFSPVDIGLSLGFFRQEGLDLTVTGFGGSANVHRAMAAGALDIVLGAGTDLAFIAKHSPEIGIAEISAIPDLGFIVPYDSPLKTLDDLRGKRIGVSTAGSLTAWLASDLAQTKGWSLKDVALVSVGNEQAGQFAAMKTGQVDAIVETNVFGFQLEQRHEGRLLAPASSYVKNFISNAIFASNSIVESQPEDVRRFLAGWLKTIAFMHDHKSETVTLARKVTGYDQAIQDRDYDDTVPLMSRDGRFSPAGLQALADSFVELGILPDKPDMTKLYTESFLPHP